MPKNEDGEFELVLGNKQLLSMFFVVVVLLGVFFVMGYIVGRNSAPLLSAENTHRAENKPAVVDTPAPKPTPAPESQPAPAETGPARADTAKTEPQAAPQRETKAAEKAEAPRSEAPSGPAQSDQTVPGGTYLQLSATDNRADADRMVDTLRKNGFQALVLPNPDKAGWVRVYVGPMGAADVNKTRDELTSKSFNGKGAIPKKF